MYITPYHLDSTDIWLILSLTVNVFLLDFYAIKFSSFFVVVPVYTTPFANIDDANNQGAPICVQNGTTAYTVLQSGYPGTEIPQSQSAH